MDMKDIPTDSRSFHSRLHEYIVTELRDFLAWHNDLLHLSPSETERYFFPDADLSAGISLMSIAVRASFYSLACGTHNTTGDVVSV